MADLHVDSSFYKQSLKIDNNHKIKEWINYSIGQSTVIQELDKKRPALSNLNQTQNHKIEEDMLILKAAHISFVALTSTILS